MSRLFLADKLTTPIFERFHATARRADVCSAVDVYDSALARRVMADARWRAGDIRVWDRGFDRVAHFTQELALRQEAIWFSTRTRRGVLAAGLDSRLRMVGLSTSFYEYCLETLPSYEELDLDLVSDDPYVLNAFDNGRWLSRQPRTRNLRLASFSSGLRASLRELAATQAWVRLSEFGRRSAPLPPLPAPGPGVRTLLVMAVSNRSVTMIEPALRRLQDRGWRVVATYYGSATDRHLLRVGLGTSLEFDTATAGWQGEVDPQLPTGTEWTLPTSLLEQSPLSPFWLHTALEAAWQAGSVMVARHRRLLARVRPDVVFHFANDLPHLALQTACEEASIPTVYVPHGFEAPARNFYSFCTTASALYGSGCLENNRVATDGRSNSGLVTVGHPPHDRLLQTAALPGPRPRPSGLRLPPHRPHLVLGLAGWGYDLICHLQQERFLALLAAGLPEDAYLVCKLHPGLEEREQCESALAARLPRDAYCVVGEREHGTFDLIAACDVAVSNERSMVMVDTMLLGRPLIGIRHVESPLGCGDRNHPGKDFDRTCWVVQDGAELKAAITALTQDSSAAQAMMKDRPEYLHRYLTADGRAAERLATLAEQLAAGLSPDALTLDADDASGRSTAVRPASRQLRR